MAMRHISVGVDDIQIAGESLHTDIAAVYAAQTKRGVHRHLQADFGGAVNVRDADHNGVLRFLDLQTRAGIDTVHSSGGLWPTAAPPGVTARLDNDFLAVVSLDGYAPVDQRNLHHLRAGGIAERHSDVFR